MSGGASQISKTDRTVPGGGMGCVAQFMVEEILKCLLPLNYQLQAKRTCRRHLTLCSSKILSKVEGLRFALKKEGISPRKTRKSTKGGEIGPQITQINADCGGAGAGTEDAEGRGSVIHGWTRMITDKKEWGEVFEMSGVPAKSQKPIVLCLAGEWGEVQPFDLAPAFANASADRQDLRRAKR